MVEAIILDNIRSAHNVGSALRTADAFKVSYLITIGITPHLVQEHDPRLPHVIEKATKRIHKTSLGAENTVQSVHFQTFTEANAFIKKKQLTTIAIEQSPGSQPLQSFSTKQSLALIFGNEVTGIPADHLELCDAVLEIPMQGAKESLNVSVSIGIALYALQ